MPFDSVRVERLSFLQEKYMTFNQMMIHFCSPAICKIKPANIFFIKAKDFSVTLFDEWKENLLKHGIKIICGNLSEKTVYVFVYNPEWERKILSNKIIQTYLSSKNYSDFKNINSVINKIINRMKNKTGFPHEIGIILGYPIEDVICFEKNQGKNCKYCGCWKSYTDVEKARQSLCDYKDCQILCMKWLNEGYTISQIICEYKKISAA